VAFTRYYKRNGRKYAAKVENYRDAGNLKQRYLEYLGPVNNDVQKDTFPKDELDLNIKASLTYGSVIALDYIANQLGLRTLLGEYADQILTLVYCHCHNYRGTNHVPRWMKTTDLSNILKGANITSKTLRNGIVSLQKMNHFDLQSSIFENTKELFGDDTKAVFYDVTNTPLSGSGGILAEKGKSKKGIRGQKLIQIGLAVTSSHGFPIFHQTHPGNTHDGKMFDEAFERLKSFGVRQRIIALDRGMYSKQRVSSLAKAGWKIIMGVPAHKGIKNFISDLDFTSYSSLRYFVKCNDSLFNVIVKPVTINEVSGRYIFIINPYKKSRIELKRKAEILRLQETGDEIPPSMAKFFTKAGLVNTHAIKRAEKVDGLTVLFTNTKFSVTEIVNWYFNKDLIEKSFQMFKGQLNLSPIRAYLDGNIEAHATICELSYSLMTTLRYHLKNSKLPVKTVSAPRAIEELSRIHRVYYHSNKKDPDGNMMLSKLVTLSRMQENILTSISPTLLSL
jgi:transposase